MSGKTLLFALALCASSPVCSTDSLPDPVILTASPAFGGFGVEMIFDDDECTDYASRGGGTGTFIEFDFGAPVLIVGVVWVDRRTAGGGNGACNDGAGDNVTEFELRLGNDPAFEQNAAFAIVPSPDCCDRQVVSLEGGVGVLARFVRYDVTMASGGNVGAAEITFLTGPIFESGFENMPDDAPQ